MSRVLAPTTAEEVDHPGVKIAVVPVELKPYDNPARYNESLATHDWDIGLAALDPYRADHLAFSGAVFVFLYERRQLKAASCLEVDRAAEARFSLHGG